jgi:PAS domain S-box-containing protein
VTSGEADRDLRSRDALLNDVDAVIWEADADTGLFTFVSERARDVLGLAPQALVDGPDLWADHVHPGDRDLVVRTFLEQTTAARAHDLEYRFVRDDGDVVWLHGIGHTVVDPQGRPRAIRGLWIDVTARHRGEAGARDEDAPPAGRETPIPTEALGAGTSLLAAAAHDLRTPIAAILGLALTLEHHPIGEHDARDMAERIAANARRLDRMVSDLLDVDRAMRGRLAPSPQPVDLGALVARVVRDFEAVDPSRVSVTTEDVVVAVDPGKAERIVAGLLENAVRRGPVGTSICVEVRAESGGGTVDVKDRGPDISAEERRAILQPLLVAPGSDQAHGTRIAIALVATLAKLHGGRLSVHAHDGSTSFRVWLPATSGIGSCG